MKSHGQRIPGWILMSLLHETVCETIIFGNAFRKPGSLTPIMKECEDLTLVCKVQAHNNIGKNGVSHAVKWVTFVRSGRNVVQNTSSFLCRGSWSVYCDPFSPNVHDKPINCQPDVNAGVSL